MPYIKGVLVIRLSLFAESYAQVVNLTSPLMLERRGIISLKDCQRRKRQQAAAPLIDGLGFEVVGEFHLTILPWTHSLLKKESKIRFN
jgi:hypothetical protein